MSEPRFLTPTWGGLRWSPWVALGEPAAAFHALPWGPGVYRVRVEGCPELAYVGQTGRGLRERLRTLAVAARGAEMPWNDPHTAAPGLWALAVGEGVRFACAAAEVAGDAAGRRGAEDWLLWQYRLERGRSTLLNHGHFPAGYVKSGPRRSGRRGGVGEGVAMASAPPLALQGEPGGGDWMGLAWSEAVPLLGAPAPPVGGVYLVLDERGHPVYIGESADVRARLAMHARSLWGVPVPHVRWAPVPVGVPATWRREWETHLLGVYVETVGGPPRHQYGAGPEVGPDGVVPLRG